MYEFVFMERLAMLARQTEAGEIDWELTEYLPIGFLLADEYDEKSCDTISQSFTATAIIGGENVTVSIRETINIPSGKGDFYVELETDDFTKEWGLSFDEVYDDCPADRLLDLFGDLPILAFCNAIVPYLVKNCQAEIQEGLLGKRFYNEKDIPEKTIMLPLVMKAESMCERDDLIGFHEMVLDTGKRP